MRFSVDIMEIKFLKIGNCSISINWPLVRGGLVWWGSMCKWRLPRKFQYIYWGSLISNRQCMLAKAMNKGLRSKLGYISSNTLLQHKIQLFCILGTARYFKMLDTSQTLKLVSRPTSYTQCNNICFICNNSVQCMLLNVIVFNIILFFFFTWGCAVRQQEIYSSFDHAPIFPSFYICIY